MQKVILLELNEIAFDLLLKYVEAGDLPNFKRLLDSHGHARTASEAEHRFVNPWIQWVTAHTGLEYAEHQVFRMGDVVKTDLPHIWDRLESKGCQVAALSPFNSLNRCQSPQFFVPDPWTETDFAGPWDMRFLYEALGQVADDYASERIAPASLFKLGMAALVNMQWRNFFSYLRDTLGYLRGRRWYRALVCDRLLTDTFIHHWKKGQPDYASLCLNGGAHLQHHYMLNSRFYTGPRSNPDWYVGADQDPLLDIYKLYDRVIADLLKLQSQGARLMIATGLGQAFHERHSLYYRMDRHDEVLQALGIPYRRIHPLMTEDFVVECEDEAAARRTQEMLEETTASSSEVFYVDNADVEQRRTLTGNRVFYVDNRGSDLYVQLLPTAVELPQGLNLNCGDRCLENLADYVSFAQLKNGHHVGEGYFIDTGLSRAEHPQRFRLSELAAMIESAVLFGGYEADRAQAAA